MAAQPLVDWPIGAEVLQLLQRGAGVLAVERKGSCPLEWGEGEHKLVGFSQRVKFQEAGVMCKGLGGSQVSAHCEFTISAPRHFVNSGISHFCVGPRGAEGVVCRHQEV